MRTRAYWRSKKDISERNTVEAAPNLSPDDALLEEFFLLVAKIATRLTRDTAQDNNYGTVCSQGGEEP